MSSTQVSPTVAVRCSPVVAALLLLASGCSNDEGAKTPSISLDAAFEASPFASGDASVTGFVTDVAGEPLAAVPVSMCAAACWPSVTDVSGRFHFSDLSPDDYAVDVRGDRVADDQLLSTIFSLPVRAGTQQLAAPVRLYRADIGQSWNGADRLTIGGLELTPLQPLDVAELQRLTGDTSISGVMVPPADWPSYRLVHAGVTYEPRAMWALRPFAHVLPAALELRIGDPVGHVVDAETALFLVDVTTGQGQWVGAAEPADSERPGATIGVISWVILAAPSTAG